MASEVAMNNGNGGQFTAKQSGIYIGGGHAGIMLEPNPANCTHSEKRKYVCLSCITAREETPLYF